MGERTIQSLADLAEVAPSAGLEILESGPANLVFQVPHPLGDLAVGVRWSGGGQWIFIGAWITEVPENRRAHAIEAVNAVNRDLPVLGFVLEADGKLAYRVALPQGPYSAEWLVGAIRGVANTVRTSTPALRLPPSPPTEAQTPWWAADEG